MDKKQTGEDIKVNLLLACDSDICQQKKKSQVSFLLVAFTDLY